MALTVGMISAPSAAEHPTPLLKADAAAEQWVTLITGDRIAVDAKGAPVSIERAAGRERIPVEVSQYKGHTQVVPSDAAQLVAAGTLDRRLFDVTELAAPAYRKAHPDGLGLIVSYTGQKPEAKTELRSADGVEVTRSYSKLNAEAVTAPVDRAADVWQALTDQGKAGLRSTAPGVRKVWLDGQAKVSLDVSVPQIGAPDAWKAGFDGKGVKVAVLDTGIDQTHPDLAGQVAEAKNFTTDPSAVDGHGHGTHVASTIVGTGAMSGGKYKGVAPGAQLLVGKVLANSGSGSDSWILAGMEWAAEQHADIVSMSLGGTDNVGTDPLEEAVDTLSADGGPLFVIAAGNAGPSEYGTVGTPGSADAALTVGAVDKNDVMASFSSSGPRLGGGAIKPDVTAPGVGIVAARAAGTTMGTPGPDGYTAASGTSMATPHVAGAAALLKQQHPDWTGQQLKELLSSATSPGNFPAYQQGSGRIDVTKAIRTTVVAESGSINYGTQAWPHDDDQAVEKTVTYRNLGTQPVTLDLTVSGTAPGGSPAPQGMFTLGAPQLTVPAGGTADAKVSADTRLGGDVNGVYDARITATAGDQVLTTAAVVERATESYAVTYKYLDRDGKPATQFETKITGLEGAGVGTNVTLDNTSGTTVRLPKGRYMASNIVRVVEGDTITGIDSLFEPSLVVDKDQTITIDARDAKPVDITVPDPQAASTLVRVSAEVEWLFPLTKYILANSFDQIRIGNVGGPGKQDEVKQEFYGNFARPDGTEYNVAYGTTGDRVSDGYTRHPGKDAFAAADVRVGSPAPGKKGALSMRPDTGMGISLSITPILPIPRDFRMYVSADDGQKWDVDFQQRDSAGTLIETRQEDISRAYEAGKTYQLDYNIGVFGPQIDGASTGAVRSGNTISASVPLFADSAGHNSASLVDSAQTSLYRNGELVSSKPNLPLSASFTVPADQADYRLTATASRSGVSDVSTKVSTEWTFSSANTAQQTFLPLSAVRFTPKLAVDSTTPAHRLLGVPVAVLGAGAGDNLKSLQVYASYDKGAHWIRTAVLAHRALVLSPAAGKSVSLKAVATDKQGNTVTQEVIDAYRAK
ncbi:S8 family peptidase [Streptomyces beijiangensis]|uniref:S8 family peptidase n=2 Tax=Streptomyces beijiangensis TaxID=163361 RepID=A0A939JIL2_9ACTN|nr:S8 family peptidase [Streptomyces beijiangensis]